MNDELLHDMTKRDIKETGGNISQHLAVAIQNTLQEKGMPFADTEDMNAAINSILYSCFYTKKGIWKFDRQVGDFLRFVEVNSHLFAACYCNPNKPNQYSKDLLDAMGKTWKDVDIGDFQEDIFILANINKYTSGGKVYYSLKNPEPYKQ